MLNLSILVIIVLLFVYHRFLSQDSTPDGEQILNQETSSSTRKEEIPKPDKESIESLIIIKKVLRSSFGSTMSTKDTKEASLSENETKNNEASVLSPPSSKKSLLNTGIEQTQDNPYLGTDPKNSCTEVFLDDFSTCKICLDTFEVGEFIGCSHNTNCIHYFHKDCIINWLISGENVTCPICRRDFLVNCSTKMNTKNEMSSVVLEDLPL